MRVVVVGGGISGLTAAYLARAAGHHVVCVDAGASPGGLIHTERHEGFLCEVGPQAVLDDAPDTMSLLAALGLEARAVSAAPEAHRRFIYARGALHPLPMSPPAMLRSGLLSPRGKLRLLAEPFVPARGRGPRRERPHTVEDDAETVAAFGVRRLGREAARNLLNTAVIGIYAADATTLSIASAFPRLAAMERQHGSLFRGMLAARRAGKQAGKKPGRPISFPEGLGELTAALAAALGTGALLRGNAVGVEPDEPGRGWRVIVNAGTARDTRPDGPQASLSLSAERESGAAQAAIHARQNVRDQVLEANAVILAIAPESAAGLLRPIVPGAHDALIGSPTAPIAVCCLGFRDTSPTAMGMDLAAYGLLVARGQEPRLLGCQYESSTFPGRAPPGGVLLRAILGGHGEGFDPGVVRESDAEVARRAVADLSTVAGLKRQPDLVRVWKHPRGIPLYAPGHAARVAAVDEALRHHPGLFVIGHGLRGVGVNESIRAATALVRDQLSPSGSAA